MDLPRFLTRWEKSKKSLWRFKERNKIGDCERRNLKTVFSSLSKLPRIVKSQCRNTDLVNTESKKVSFGRRCLDCKKSSGRLEKYIKYRSNIQFRYISKCMSLQQHSSVQKGKRDRIEKSHNRYSLSILRVREELTFANWVRDNCLVSLLGVKIVSFCVLEETFGACLNKRDWVLVVETQRRLEIGEKDYKRVR